MDEWSSDCEVEKEIRKMNVENGEGEWLKMGGKRGWSEGGWMEEDGVREDGWRRMGWRRMG